MVDLKSLIAASKAKQQPQAPVTDGPAAGGTTDVPVVTMTTMEKTNESTAVIPLPPVTRDVAQAPANDPLKAALAGASNAKANPLAGLLGKAKQATTAKNAGATTATTTTTTALVPTPTTKLQTAPDKAQVPAVIATDLAAIPVSSAITADDFNTAGMPFVLPENETEAFKEALNLLRNNIDNKEMVAQAIQHVMLKMKEDVKFAAMLLPEDCGMMVRGLRFSYGTMLQSKTEKTAKKTAKSGDITSVMAALDGMEFNI